VSYARAATFHGKSGDPTVASDGNGNLSGSGIASTGGQTQPLTFTGTYTISAIVQALRRLRIASVLLISTLCSSIMVRRFCSWKAIQD
jgi:hypothetical protein